MAVLPDPNSPTGSWPLLPTWIPPAGDLNDLGDASRTKQEVAARDTPLPVIYGKDKVQGRVGVVYVDDTNGFLYLAILWAESCTAIDAVFVDGVLTSDATEGLSNKGGTVENHASGGTSTLLSTAISGYTDNLTCCYTALKIPRAYSRNFPRVEAIIRGKAVYDPRTTTTAYSENPVLAARDLAVSAGWSVNDTTAIAAANWNDSLIGGAASRTIGLTLAEPRAPEDWMRVMRVYTGCFIAWDAGQICFYPDQAVTIPGDRAATLTTDDIVAGSVSPKRRSPLDTPTTCIVEYRDASVDAEWRTERAVYTEAGLPVRTTRVSLPGVHRYAQAYREAKERIKKLQTDLTITLTVYDIGLKLQVGSVINITHPLLTTGDYRIINLQHEQGRWQLTVVPYDATVYSSDAPTYTPPASSDLGAPSSPVYSNVTGMLTNESHTVAADVNGLNYSLTGAGGTFMVWNAVTNVTGSGPVYSIVGGTDNGANWTLTQNGLTLTISETTGVYSLSGAAWSSSLEVFTLRAVYGGVTIDRVYSISKSVTGATGQGNPGYNTATLVAYKRSASAPVDTPGQLTYTFATADWTPGNSWSKTIPAVNGNPLYARSATAYSTSSADTIEIADWSAATLVLQDGTNGSPGLNVATAYLYQRTTTSSPPASLPTASHDYTFSSGAISGLPDQGWTATIPAFSGTNPYLWVTLATASGSSSVDTILNTEWQTARLLSQNGTDGSLGYNAATLTAYKRNATQPSDTPGTSITYTFNGASWTPGNGWSKTIPAADGNPCWARSASAYSQNATDDILSAEWSAAVQVFADGTDGDPGLNVATAYIYQRTTADLAPSVPSVDATFTFGTGDITNLNNGWTDTIPAFDGTNPYLWVSTATASSASTSDAIGTGEWATPQKMSLTALGKSMSVYSDRQVITCDSAGSPSPSSQTTVFTVVKQNTTVVPTWTISDAAGTVVTDPTSYFSGTNKLNLLLQSNSFSTSPWGLTNVTITASNTIAPDGTLTGVKAAATATAATVLSQTLTATNTSHVFSIYAKKGTNPSNSFILRNDTTPANLITVTITWATMAVSTSGTGVGTVTPVGNDWYRVVLYATSGITVGNTLRVYAGFTGSSYTAGEYCYLWGAQVETTSTPSNYIPTTTAQAYGVQAETVSLTAANFTTIRGSTQGVIVTARLTDSWACIADKVSLLKAQDGASGASIAELQIYRRSSSAPSTPTGGSYDFSTQTLTPPTNWSSGIPAGNDPVYVCRGVASVTGTTGTDSTITWSAPVLFSQEGSSIDIIFQRSATQPSTPSPSSGVPANWYSDVASVPASSNPMWSCVGTRSNAGQNWTWDTPVRVEGAADTNLTPPVSLTIPIANPMGGWALLSGSLSNASTLNTVPGPYGDYPTIVRTTGDGLGSFPSGGWYCEFKHDFPVSATKAYVSYIWIRRRTSNTANFYFGCTKTSGIEDLAGTGSTNPYFCSGSGSTQFTLNSWYLMVGVIHPDGYTGGDTGIAGVYDPQNGASVIAGTEFQHAAGSTAQYIRFGFNNSTTLQGTSDGYDFLPVGTFAMDGSHPTKEQVLNTRPNGIVGFLTNEAHTLPATSDGTISSYSGASGTFKVFDGFTDMTGNAAVTYSAPTNPQGLTYTGGSIIGSSGAYNIDGGFDPGEAGATVTFRAVYKGLTIEKIFTLAKSKSGVDAGLLRLTASSQQFTRNADLTFNPTTQTITFNAILTNVSGTVTWVATIYNNSGGSLGTVTLGGSGNTGRTLTHTQFHSYGTTAAFAVVSATLGSLTDQITVNALNAGAAGTPAKSVSLTADSTAFFFMPNGLPVSGSQTITFTASRQNISTATTWTVTPSVSYSGSGDQITISITSFGLNDSILVRASADGYYQELRVYAVRPRGGDTNMLDLSTWNIGGTGTQGSFTAQDVGGTESSIVLAGVSSEPSGPSAFSEPLWKATSNGGNDLSGGWVYSGIPVVAAKTYRIATWFRYTGTSGNVYLGCDTSNTNNMAGTQDTNPHFLSSTKATLNTAGVVADTWYLAVGVVHGSGYGSTEAGIAGIYDSAGRKLVDLVEFKNRGSGNVTQSHRAFQGNATTSGDKVYFARPRFDEMNGNEPSIADLCTAGGLYVPTTRILANAVSKQAFAKKSSDSQLDTTSPTYDWLSALTVSMDSRRATGESFDSVIRVSANIIIYVSAVLSVDFTCKVRLRMYDLQASAYVSTDPWEVIPSTSTYNDFTIPKAAGYYVLPIERVYTDSALQAKNLRYELEVGSTGAHANWVYVAANTFMLIEESRR